MLTDLRTWLAAFVLTLIGLGGLFYAAHGEGEAYRLGLGVFGAAMVIIAILVRRALDAADASH